MIEQLKRYKVTCDGSLSVTYDGRKYYEDCGATCEVWSTSKSDALRELPAGWTTEYFTSWTDIRCPKEHF